MSGVVRTIAPVGMLISRVKPKESEEQLAQVHQESRTKSSGWKPRTPKHFTSVTAPRKLSVIICCLRTIIANPIISDAPRRQFDVDPY